MDPSQTLVNDFELSIIMFYAPGTLLNGLNQVSTSMYTCSYK